MKKILVPGLRAMLWLSVLNGLNGLIGLAANAAVPITAPVVEFRTSLTPLQLLLRQEAHLILEVVDEGVLQWQAPGEIIAPGFSVRKLAETQREELLEGVRYSVTRYSWAVMPLRPGSLSIAFAEMEASRFGERLRYAIVPKLVEVAPLPSYLPVQMHVGELKLSAQPLSLPTEIIVGRPVNWTLQLTGSGISREGIAKSLHKLISSGVNVDTGAGTGKAAMLDFYPASFNLKDGANNNNPLEQILEITLPIQSRRAGEYVLPELRLPYFNPATGLIEMATLPAQRILVTDPFWRQLAVGVSVLVAMLAVLLLVREGYKRWQQRKSRQQWLASLAAARDATQLRHALLASESGRTLRQWLRDREARQGKNTELSGLIQQLEQNNFGQTVQNGAFPVLQQELIALLRYAPE